MPAVTGNRGITLVEVLVTLLIVSVGLLGVLGMQMSAVNSGQQALLRSQAAVLTQSLAERMRVNRALINPIDPLNRTDNFYSELNYYTCPADFNPLDAVADCSNGHCDAGEIALIDIRQLTCQTDQIHPDLKLAVECVTPPDGETSFHAPGCPPLALYRLSASWPAELWQTPGPELSDPRCPADSVFTAGSAEHRDCVVLELQLGVSL